MIGNVAQYSNQLSNSPKKFDRSFSTYQAKFQIFNSMIRQLELEAAAVELKAGTSVYLVLRSMAPNAAMAIATTFGGAACQAWRHSSAPVQRGQAQWYFAVGNGLLFIDDVKRDIHSSGTRKNKIKIRNGAVANINDCLSDRLSVILFLTDN